MNRSSIRQVGKSSVEIVEEAVHLLRMSPVSIIASYYVGTLPFILGFLYFWSDMSRSSFAYRHCAEAALGLSLLFLWMKCWQAVFARRLKAHVCGEPLPRWTLRRIVRLAAVQIAIQPSSLFVLPIAALLLLPFGWVYASYNNAAVIGDDEDADVATVLKRSWQQAGLWPRQNHILISILFIFALFVFVNLAIAIGLVPVLVRSLVGVETVLSRGRQHMFNTTFLAAVWGTTYLCINPITKAVYMLRCFYGESLHTGTDLRAELRSVAAKWKAAAALILMLVLCAGTCRCAALETENSDPAIDGGQEALPSVSPAELDQTISDIMRQPEYAWRMPREKPPKDEIRKGWLAGFIDAVGRTLGRWVRRTGRWLGRIADRIADWLARHLSSRDPSGGRTGWMTSVRGLTTALLIVIGVTLAIMLFKSLRSRRAGRAEVIAEAVLSTPDLGDEDLAADELPADTWSSIARELLEKGELRLALRAFYLASLAQLAQHEMITIAKFKSNREYERELRRRAHALPDLLTAFAQNVTVFDGAWYGMHKVTRGIMAGFAANLERIRACVEGQ